MVGLLVGISVGTGVGLSKLGVRRGLLDKFSVEWLDNLHVHSGWDWR